MRNILFRKYIPIEYTRDQESGDRVRLAGTGCYSDSFEESGKFLAWGTGYVETGVGIAHFAIAIVELPDGTVREIPLDQIKFID